MKRLLLVVALLPALLYAQSWPFQDFGYGYDLLTDQPTAPIIELTFQNSTTWTSAITEQTYIVPDQVEIMDYSSSSLSKSMSIIRNVTEYQQAAYSWHNFGIGFFGLFGFDFSHEAGYVKKMLLDGKHVLYIAYKQFQFLELAAWPYDSRNAPNAHFTRALNNLPTTLNTPQDRAQYHNFISLFGTSYFERARYGGDIKYFIQVDSQLMQQESEEWVSFQVGLFITYMDIKFGFDFGRNVSRHNISDKFWEHATAKCSFRPFGDTIQDCSNMTSVGFQNWVSSAMLNPVLLAPTLRNITDLVNDSQKRANLQMAVQNYLNHPNGTQVLAQRQLRDKLSRKAPHQKMFGEQKVRGIARGMAGKNAGVIPGYEVIGMGLDAVSMELTGLPLIQLDTQQSQQYPCTSNNQYGPACWQNPFYPKYQFFIPWNVYLENTPSAYLLNGSDIFSSYDDFEQYYRHTTSHHSFFGSRSKTVFHFYQKYFEEDSALTFVYQSRTWYRLTLPPLPPPSLSPKAAQVIALLPPKYNRYDPDNLRQYRKAILSLGTHVVYTAEFGGIQKMESWFHKCLISTYSEDWVKEQSGWSFFGIITDNSGHYNYNSKLNLTFTQWSSVEVSYTGGKAFKYEPSAFEDWVETLKDRPIPTKFDILPISMLIQDTSLSASYEAAVQDYLTESHNLTLSLQGDFAAKDPWTKPSWCKWT